MVFPTRFSLIFLNPEIWTIVEGWEVLFRDLFGQTEDGKFIRRIKDEADDDEEVDMKPSTSAVVDTKPIAVCFVFLLLNISCRP